MLSLLVAITVILSSSMTFERVYATSTTELTRNFYPSDDAFVEDGDQSASNFGSSASLRIGPWVGLSIPVIAHIDRSFIKFDLTTIPPGSKITLARLYLYMAIPPPSSRELYCHRVADSWTEGTITWGTQPDVTFDHYPFISTGTSAGWLYWDTTYWVEKFAAKDSITSEDNYGWRIRDKSEDSPMPYGCIEMYSREASSNKPYLQVNYYPPHLELELPSTTIQAGNWVKMSVWRVTQDGEYVTRGDLNVKLSSTSTSVNKKFSLTEGGTAITGVTIPDGSKKADFYYYDDKAGTWEISVSTDDYRFFVIWPYYIQNYGDDKEQLAVTPGPLDHFAFDTISSPKQVAVPFSIAITAYDAYNNVKTDYTGTNSLSDTTGTINPAVTGAFVNGKWTGLVTINRIDNNVKITTSGGLLISPKTGESNVFDVKAGPPAKLAISPSSFTMAAGVTYSYLSISLRDANDFETTHTSPIAATLSTTSSDGEFRQFGTATRITSVTIPSGESSVKVDYYDIRGGAWTLTALASGLLPGTATATVIPDMTPPVTTINLGDPTHQVGTSTYVSGSTAFSLSATDEASGVKETKYRIDDGSWNAYSAEFNLATLPEGSHTIGYYSIDRADNDETEKTLTVVLDKTHPTISGASPTGRLILGSTSVTFTVTVEDAGSGVEEVELIVDGISQGAMAESVETYTKTASLSEGNHTWSVEAVDNVQNSASQSYSFTLTVDRDPPTVSGMSTPSNPVFGESTTITCQVSDALSGVKEVNLYFSTSGGSSWNKVEMTLRGGVYTGSISSQMFFTTVQYYVEAIDNIGNVFQTPISTYTVGIPMWLYIAAVALIVVLVAAPLLRRRKPAPQPTYAPPPTPPPPPPSQS
jgi:hypothetical protein